MPRLAVSSLRLDSQRAELSEEIVVEKMEALMADECEPIVVRFDGDAYFVTDGFHRIEAARRLEMADVDAEIVPGTLDDIEREMLDALKTEPHE